MKVINIQKKFSEKHIDKFINDIFVTFRKNPNEEYLFDLSNSEWISNQSLLLFTGVLKYFYEKKIKFEVKLTKDYSKISAREAKQIVQLWEIWKIHSIFRNYEYEDYFKFSNSFISNLKNDHKIYLNYNLYNRLGITPFITLEKINNYLDEGLVNYIIDPIYNLNNIIEAELKANKCAHPFIEKTISAIITKELYENFLDHYSKSFFNTKEDWAFMSVSLKKAQKNDNQLLLESNFNEEELIESKDFFYENGNFKNEPLIQFSFFDFGIGIIETLKIEYLKEYGKSDKTLFDNINENEILKYAFRHDTSQNPILDKYDTNDVYIPRGLFDLLVIIKRYRGLIIVRSNYAKILFNFSRTENIDEAFSEFGNKNDFFPGTFISIYIPALSNENNFNKSVIKPNYFQYPNKIGKKTNNINVFSLLSKINYSKNSIYNSIIKELKLELNKNNEYTKLNYISFFGVDDDRIIKKIIFFLLTDYDIYEQNSVIILHPPSKEIIQQINLEILDLNLIIKNYKIHPLPLFYLNIVSKEIELLWLGVYNSHDKKLLNQLLFDDYSLSISDFEDNNNTLGNVNIADKYGNFKSKVPSSRKLIIYYERYESNLIEEAIKENDCLKKSGLYLCNGNYYQNEFLQITDLLNNKIQGNVVSKYLFNKIQIHVDISKKAKYIAITSSSHKILNSLIKQKLILEDNCIFFDNYLTFEKDKNIDEIQDNTDYILVCDSISTGNSTIRLNEIIKLKTNSKLILIAILVNTLHEKFEGYEKFINEYGQKLIYLYKLPIVKKRRHELDKKELDKGLYRVNPYTNIPITFSQKLTFENTVILHNEEFLNFVSNDDISISFKIFNNLIHPYFFNTKKILFNENNKILGKIEGNSLLKLLFEKLKQNIDFPQNKYLIFYPKGSDIEEIDMDFFINKILKDSKIEYYSLERYNTESGWKFPHTTNYFENIIKIEKAPNILIIDDGSCSGDSLLQMVNELAYFEPSKIDLICLIGRIDDHKREFFSRIKSFKKQSNEFDQFEVNIYFGSHWHV